MRKAKDNVKAGMKTVVTGMGTLAVSGGKAVVRGGQGAARGAVQGGISGGLEGLIIQAAAEGSKELMKSLAEDAEARQEIIDLLAAIDILHGLSKGQKLSAEDVETLETNLHNVTAAINALGEKAANLGVDNAAQNIAKALKLDAICKTLGARAPSAMAIPGLRSLISGVTRVLKKP